ncbi:hypothetical protein MN116_007422 [Schistosoma mekongi]|uniref:Nonsense-mediated mRNA decay factor SMG8 n=1 Tax=Schistosoma mekongi TaxID=38744 RepID=A0AAE1ZAL0_SCHME|nr:hypothetical protein MN116_007422 [Schistosoma mekongi]
MRHPIDVYTRDLPLPRDWLNNGRASVPRLLFIFKLQPAQARLIKNWKLVRQLEQNIVTQIFNTFYETGLISNISANQLFMLPGHNFVHVLFGNQHIKEEPYRRPSCEDIAQQYFEFILKNINHISNMSTDKIPNLFGSSTFLSTNSNDPAIAVSPPSPQNFPAPDQPAQHSLSSFLHLHVESMLDQAASKNSSFGQTTIAYELPTCKAWFMACYRIYTSLVSDEQLTTIPTPEVHTDQSDSSSCIIGGEGGGSVVSLSQSWHNALISILCPTLHTSTLSIAQKQASQKSVVEEEVLPISNYNNPWSITDPINRLSVVRYRSAISAAESYYKQDLPVHYSCTYHIIKVISAYNVAIGLTRGQSVFRLLEKLSSRLTHLYLAGRVTCSVLSLSGQPCQYELHRVPDDSDTLKNLLSVIDDKSKENYTVLDVNENLPSHNHYQPNSSTNKLRGIDLTVKDECLIPSGLSGKWKRYWIECAIKDFTNNNSSQSNQLLSDGKQVNDTLNLDNPDQHLAVISHRSDVIMISSCSCGRQQAERSDPFDYKEANWRFYQLLSNICCNKLTSIPLAPQILSDSRHTFCLPNENPHNVALMSPSVHRTNTNKLNEKTISVLTKPIKVVSSPSPSPPTSRVQKSKESDSTDNVNEDIGLSQIEDNDLLLLSADSDRLRSSEVIDRKSADSDKSKNDNYTDSVVDLSGSRSSPNVIQQLLNTDSISIPQNEIVNETTENKDGVCVKLHTHVLSSPSKTGLSTDSANIGSSYSGDSMSLCPVVFRDGVPNTNWLVGDLPLYPSWSIHALGKYFSYSHSSGLPCRGFMHNSNFLLPWDVSLMNNTWSGSEPGRFTKSARGRYRGSRTESDTVKLFLGFEMECSMGHRFFITGTDRIMDGPMQSSQVRRAVHSLLTRDLPIYMPCQCHHPTSHILLGNTRHSTNPTSEWDADGNSSTTKMGCPKSQTVIAQLSRIYLAIPAAPIQVRFQPCVRPGPPKVTPIFHLGHTLDQCCDKKLDGVIDLDYDQSQPVDEDYYFYEDPIKTDVKLHPDTSRSEKYQSPGYVTLDNGYLWVIRLPLAYHDGTKLYPKPLYPSDCIEWKLLKGCIKLVA